MMVRMQIQFTEEQAAALRDESKRRGISISAIVRERYDAAPPKAPSRARAFASFGKYSSGRSDISRNHDLYVDPEYDPEQRPR